MKKRASIQRKAESVSSLIKGIEDCHSFLVFEYLGLNAEEISKLRKTFRNADSRLIVNMNNVLNRAFSSLNIKLQQPLKGPNAILLIGKNFQPFREISNLAKDKNFVKLKTAYIDKSVIEGKDLELFVSLGSKEDMLLKFSNTVLSPIYKLLFLLKNINL